MPHWYCWLLLIIFGLNISWNQLVCLQEENVAGEDGGKSEEQKLRERKTKVRYEGATRMNTRRGERWGGRWRVRSMGNRRGDREREKQEGERVSWSDWFEFHVGLLGYARRGRRHPLVHDVCVLGSMRKSITCQSGRHEGQLLSSQPPTGKTQTHTTSSNTHTHTYVEIKAHTGNLHTHTDRYVAIYTNTHPNNTCTHRHTQRVRDAQRTCWFNIRCLLVISTWGSSSWQL